MIEEWRDVVGYEGLYQVSNTGLVKSVTRIIKHKLLGKKTVNERILKPFTNELGYSHVRLSRGNTQKHKLIHRLVGESFISNPDNLPCINHKDENPRNNNIENLEWCTVQYNNTYGKHAERIKNTDYKAMKYLGTPYVRKIIQKTIDGEIIRVWESLTEAAIQTKTQLSKICCCCRGRRNLSNGFRWEYAEGRKCRV